MKEELKVFEHIKGLLNLKMPIDLMREKGLTCTDKLLYGILDHHSYCRGYCWVSNKTLAIELDTSTRSIQRSLAKLQARGFIKVEFHVQKGKNQRYIYTIDNAVQIKSAEKREELVNEDYSDILDLEWFKEEDEDDELFEMRKNGILN